MPRKVLVVPLACAAAVTTGCSLLTPSAAQTQATPSATASAPHSARPNPIRTLKPVRKLTAACTLLSAVELKELLGGAASTTVTAKEDKPDKSDHSPIFTCEYGSRGNRPFALSVVGLEPVAGFTPKAAVDAAAKAGHAKAHRLRGVGDAAVFYHDKEGPWVIAIAKRSHGEIRMANFAAPAVVPERKFVQVGKLVISRM